jgi:hypothetical protein
MKLSLIFALLLFAASAFGQSTTQELIRQDIKSEKINLMAGSLPLTEKQADLFWPIYRDYDHELSKLGDRRIAAIKEVGEKSETMDAKTADRLVKESFAIAEARTALLKKYYNKVAKNLGTLVAARFMQIENQMLTLLDAQIIDQVPLIKPKPAGEKKK